MGCTREFCLAASTGPNCTGAAVWSLRRNETRCGCFKVKLTPKDDKVEYSQSLPMPIQLKEDLIVELALMHKYGIITVLPFSKYASPIFAQRKPNAKLRLLLDLRKINSLIADDYTNNNHPVSTLSDAAQHLAGKSVVRV